MLYNPVTIKEIEEKSTGIFKEYNIDKVAIFGSCARGDMHYGSDIDLLVNFESLDSGLVFVEIKRKLENKLGRKVDLITYPSLLRSDFKDEILSEAKIIYEKRH